jgi:hypothetical protein
MNKIHRCTCPNPDPEQVDIDSKTTICQSCGGWFVLHIKSLAELQKFAMRYKDE